MAHQPSRSTALSAGRVQTVYFAFGSNLHLAQMAKRCPESRFLGRGMLRNHKWQINTRGYANIYFAKNEFVEGLCYLLSQKDEEKLDRNEGVNLIPSSYEKEIMDVEVYPINPSIAGRRVKEVDDYIHRQAFTPVDGSKAGEVMKALVYISYREKDDGPPKTEYISRIRAGVEDAKLLGVPRLYFDQNFTGPMGWGNHPGRASPERRGTGYRRRVIGDPPEREDSRRYGPGHASKSYGSDAEERLYNGISVDEGFTIVDARPPGEVRMHQGTPGVMAADAMHHSQPDVDAHPRDNPGIMKGGVVVNHVHQMRAELSTAEAGQEVMKVGGEHTSTCDRPTQESMSVSREGE